MIIGRFWRGATGRGPAGNPQDPSQGVRCAVWGMPSPLCGVRSTIVPHPTNTTRTLFIYFLMVRSALYFRGQCGGKKRAAGRTLPPVVEGYIYIQYQVYITGYIYIDLVCVINFRPIQFFSLIIVRVSGVGWVAFYITRNRDIT